MAIYVIGDIHGRLSTISRALTTFLEEGDTLLSAGDFGAGFIYKDKLTALGDSLAKRGVELLVVRGNHDDPEYFNGGRKIGNINFLPDYSVRELEGRKYAFLGGSLSIDRSIRIHGRDWWAGERFFLDREKLYNLPRDLDVVISHNCPPIASPFAGEGDSDIIKYWKSQDESLDSYLKMEREDFRIAETIINRNTPVQKWYFGHYHKSHKFSNNGTDYRCLDIDEIDLIELGTLI